MLQSYLVLELFKLEICVIVQVVHLTQTILTLFDLLAKLAELW